MVDWTSESDLINKELIKKEMEITKNNIRSAIEQIQMNQIKSGLSILYSTLYNHQFSSSKAFLDMCNECEDRG